MKKNIIKNLSEGGNPCGVGKWQTVVIFLRIFLRKLLIITLLLMLGFDISFAEEVTENEEESDIIGRFQHNHPVLYALTLSVIPFCYIVIARCIKGDDWF